MKSDWVGSTDGDFPSDAPPVILGWNVVAFKRNKFDQHLSLFPYYNIKTSLSIIIQIIFLPYLQL